MTTVVFGPICDHFNTTIRQPDNRTIINLVKDYLEEFLGRYTVVFHATCCDHVFLFQFFKIATSFHVDFASLFFSFKVDATFPHCNLSLAKTALSRILFRRI